MMKFSAISLGCFFLMSACRSKVETTIPTIENITESVYAAGKVKTDNQYQAYSTVSGIIDKILVTENDLVKKGSPLIILSDQSSKITRQNANLSSKYAELESNKEKLADLKNNISLAASRYSNDSMLYARQKNLWAQGIGTKTELEQRELANENSKISLESAKIKYTDLLKQLQFNAEQSKNNLAFSQVKEDDFTIKSEIEGKVYFIFPKQGELISPQTPLAVIGDASHFLLELEVDEYDIVRVKKGQQVLVSMDSYKGETFEASISKINPLMNERTKTFTVEAVFLKQPRVLYPNLTVEANIVIQTKERALTVPRNYLLNDSFVLVNKDEKRVIRTGIKDYQKVEIIDGLHANETIYKPKE
ncbi:MAG: efflux RND transporter periplasmic adaptor subunit [Chitinophagales bacterium]